MPKTVEHYQNGVREVVHKKGCHSCWECKYCQIDSDISLFIVCTKQNVSNLSRANFPYDNTRCKEFEEYEQK